MHHRWDNKIHLEFLRYLNKEQLLDMLTDEDTLQCIINHDPKLQQLQRQKEMMLASNRRFAEQNLSYRPYLKYNKFLLAERYQLLSQVICSVRQKQKELEKVHGQLNLEAPQKLVKEKLVQLMEESETAWKKFLEGDLLPVDFVEEFRSAQTLYHAHLIQLHKIQDLRAVTQQCWRTEQPLNSNLHSSKAQNGFLSNLYPVIMLPNTLLPVRQGSIKPPNLPHVRSSVKGGWFTPVLCNHNLRNSKTFKNTWQPFPFQHDKRRRDQTQ